jgi:hypothetical protein
VTTSKMDVELDSQVHTAFEKAGVDRALYEIVGSGFNIEGPGVVTETWQGLVGDARG